MAALPDVLQRLSVGLQETAQDGALRTSMDAGPPKARRRYSAVARQLSGTVLVQSSDLAAIDTFFNDVVAMGTLPFTFLHPVTGVTETAIFAAPLSREYVSDALVRLSVSMVILP